MNNTHLQKILTFPSHCRSLQATCWGRSEKLSVVVISPCAAAPGRVEQQPQHALPGSTPPPHDVVPPPGALATHNSDSCQCLQQ